MRRAVVALVAVLCLPAPAALASEQDGRGAQPTIAPLPIDPASIRMEDRDKTLGTGWRTSGDRLWTTVGNGTGFHVLVADAKDGYAWRTVATLTEPSLETDTWIGNACVTGSGDRAVVVYAPRLFTNKEQLVGRGGFTATVDLRSGAVTKLPVRTTLAYYNPGCGAGETAALTQDATDDLGKTGVLTLDTTSGKVGARVELAGQLTSAVPAGSDLVVAASRSLLKIAPDGSRTRLAETKGQPFRLLPDADGAIVFAETDGKESEISRTAKVGDVRGKAKAPAVTSLAFGPMGEIGLGAGAHGSVFITGKTDRVATLPSAVRRIDVPAGATVSTRGEAAVTEVRGQAAISSTPQPVHIAARSTKTHQDLGFTVHPGTAPAAPLPSKNATPSRVVAADQDMTDPGAVCAVKRNDTGLQVYQPKPKQVEWAADQAVKSALTITRPANWHHNGLGSHKPGAVFSQPGLTGGGQVPAQILLGILGQESNLWQASRHAMPGEYGNPLIGNFYGVDIYNADPNDDWTIRWDEADCGYGVSQQTDGMRAGQTKYTREAQIMIATDYAANVTAGLQTLENKWNELQAEGVVLHDNNPSRIENWFFAAWAYNSGWHPQGEAGANGAYGLGWGNNPINPRYPADRHPFGADPHDFGHPQLWPYEEKVIGFASLPPTGDEQPGISVPLFRAAWWGGTDGDVTTPGSARYNRAQAKPRVDRFCWAGLNDCHPGERYTPNAPGVDDDPEHDTGPCAHRNTAGQYDLKCWWHVSAQWKDDNCAQTCGHEFIRYDPGYAEPSDGVSYPPSCGAQEILPGNAVVVDDVGASTEAVRPAGWNSNGQPIYCDRQGIKADGAFSMAFAGPAAKIDLHQIGSGFGAHYWFAHTHTPGPVNDQLKITATWTYKVQITGPVQVYVHIPASHHGTKKVRYDITTANGVASYDLAQDGSGGATTDRWVPIGIYNMHNFPTVRLSTQTGDSAANDDPIAFDAVAFAPGSATTPSDKDAVLRLRNRETGNCLRIPDNSTANGVQAVQSHCQFNFSDQWVMRYLQQNADSQFEYQLFNQNTGKCLEIGGMDDGLGAVQQDCNAGNRKQVWKTDVYVWGYRGFNSVLWSAYSNKLLSVLGDPKDPAAPVGQVPWSDDPPMTARWQDWQV